MAYQSKILSSPFSRHLPAQLLDHLQGEQLMDLTVKYELPPITDSTTELKTKVSYASSPSNARIPARLSNPLIPYPQELRDLSSDNYTGDVNYIHGHHKSQIDTLRNTFEMCIKKEVIPEGPLNFDMDSLKRFARQSYSHRESMINLSTLSFATRATQHDLSIAAGSEVPFNVGTSTVSSYTSFIIMVQRLRVHMAKESKYPSFKPESVLLRSDDATYQMFSNGVYIYQSVRKHARFCIMACGGHFRIYHEALGYWFCGPTSYFDYIFTMADILNNLDVLKNCNEYVWATDMFKLMIEFAEHEGTHNSQVDFIKGMEGFLLNMSDYDEAYAMNWKPILEAVEELWELDKGICQVDYDIGLPLVLLRGHSFRYPKQSYLCRFIHIGKRLSRTHLQEISALHKLIFYAEVDAEAGVKKFLKRVHTKRKTDVNAVKNLTRLAKVQFFISYRRKHKMMPNTLGPVHKVKMLETYSNRSNFERIEALPMSWWDDIKIFDCMDNTMTDDPLEFAKDKGALKSEISFGPGDSRKELLQVIEKEEYELKDFFLTKKITPRPRLVRRTNQKHEPTPMADPARLIEKEREQKIEARLFANGELSNKHALSLITARMKKALSYFDEQLMTPTDKKRKALIHEASRELTQNDNYSLLLDIVGHNQSMQYDNTHELTEFIGNLFGYDDWGQLSHYFSHLTVFHYDEYLDKVIESHGQYGGIEGWLNPLWTLHTTLMMKLLRIMTDVVVNTIMVYSDDVNAIIQIRQASEPMVQATFSKIMQHCDKFGMTVKYSQTMLSKHRVTMLRQHYADGIRADSTLKRLIAVSAGNNSVIVSDELEVAGICSSASSAMELSNHHEACSYLKNYKLGLLLCRMPQMILSHINDTSMVSPAELPTKLSTLLYYSKDDASALDILSSPDLYQAAKNDIAAYLGRRTNNMNDGLFRDALSAVYGTSVAESRLVDSPDRVLYLQVYDKFLQDLLFYWTYTPSSLGGLGASLHINLMLSGHSVGMSKSLHYLFEWVNRYSSDQQYFTRYMSNSLAVKMDNERNNMEERIVTSTWPSDQRICPAMTSVQQAIKSMVRHHTRNKKILQMFELSDDRDKLAHELLEVFRNNFHSRIVQFYHENTSVHFIDLLISKIETSSGLLVKVRNIQRLRNSLSSRAIENIRMGADTSRTIFFTLNENSDIIQCLLTRKIAMFPRVKFIEVEEVLYDDKIREVGVEASLLTIRRCSPTHYRNGIKVFDDPKVGSETLYKGELLDNDRMLGNKEELLAAKLVAVTKWFLMKSNLLVAKSEVVAALDVVIACNLALSTLTKQNFSELFMYAPTETGGEILHRIPNIRFTTATYIRSEMNRSLSYTTDLNQRLITSMNLVDSNVNFDYLRMRYLIAAIVRDKYDNLRRLVTRYGFTKLTGIKDVQFVSPSSVTYTPTSRMKCYGELRCHTLSTMRFRYLSHSYLYEENVSDWALMPKQSEILSAEQIGKNYIEDIILRYSKDLDKDYMLLSSDMIEQGIWQPLIDKLYRIDSAWKLDISRSDTEEIAYRLKSVLESRSKIVALDKSSPVHLALQSQCLECILEEAPNDGEFQALISKYMQITQNRRQSSRLSVRLSKYQAILGSFTRHRYELAQSLIHEYMATFHFVTKTVNGELIVDTEASLNSFLEAGLAKLSLMVINPDLQVRIMILGFEYVEKVIDNQFVQVAETYRSLCSELSCTDIVIPTSLPSISSWTPLSGAEDMPLSLEEIEYTSERIPLSAMTTLDQLEPLLHYAHLCSTTGASPYVFTSHTGSDSLGAQYSLFRMLKSTGIVDETMRICDLTAGRGDGLYSMRYNNLNPTSFTREDTFSRVNHHPDVIFKNDYDVFKGGTLKFITDFDFIHVDISFTGSTHANLLDLVLMLEENGLPYSIRLNSATITGYSKASVKGLQPYKHSIAYSVSSSMKPYQVYLIGVPCVDDLDWKGPTMKDTIAFRAMALSYSQLLAPVHHKDRLSYYVPNSFSIHLPKIQATDDFIRRICDDSIGAEQLYYLQRYMAEIGPQATLEFSFDNLEPHGQQLLRRYDQRMVRLNRTTYTALNMTQIGNVSDKVRPYHEKHISSMQSGTGQVSSIAILNCDEPILRYFRTRHPLQEIRTWCNIVLGLATFCRSALLSGHEALAELYTEVTKGLNTRVSMHQREIAFAVKLLVLAARDDDYTYGVRYCHKLLSLKPIRGLSLTRTLKCYRLISYLFDDIQRMMRQGNICIRSIDAIANEIEVREKTRYRYRRQNAPPPSDIPPDALLTKIIDDSFVDLFKSLEQYAMHVVEESATETSQLDVSPETGQMMLNFDIGLLEHVDATIARLGLTPSGPRGTIDLGDDDILEYDDW